MPVKPSLNPQSSLMETGFINFPNYIVFKYFILSERAVKKRPFQAVWMGL